MANKLAKNTMPAGHTKQDFKCFGPVATEDGKFEGTKLADLGCFKQGETDSNKYYFAAVVQSSINNNWYAYFEYGRTGQSTNPQFQFIEGPSESSAQLEYCKQLHSKNDKRGQWVNHAVLGRILQPKPNKDCYLIRPQTVRNTGLPDAKNITESKLIVSKGPAISQNLDEVTNKLLKDLKFGATEYARSSIVGSAIPTKEAIDKCRDILNFATKVINTSNNEKEIIDLTNLVYSIIPKIKSRKTSKENWILSPNNINSWHSDLDAYENAIGSDTMVQSVVQMPFNLIYLDVKSNKYKYLADFIKQASRGKHNIRDMKILNIWEINRDETYKKFENNLQKITGKPSTKPLHQLDRTDIDEKLYKDFKKSGTFQLFHGTRSVNVGGILNTGLRLPKELSNTIITGAMFGPLTYHADDWRKSCGYCSTSNAYWSSGSGAIKNRGAFMFVNDVVLGNAYFPRHSQNFTKYPDGHHSIFAHYNKCSIMNNEFVTFPDQVNLRYLVEFNV